MSIRTVFPVVLVTDIDVGDVDGSIDGMNRGRENSLPTARRRHAEVRALCERLSPWGDPEARVPSTRPRMPKSMTASRPSRLEGSPALAPVAQPRLGPSEEAGVARSQ